MRVAILLSTVLAQDHFYSVFLSLQMTNQNLNMAVMMMDSCSLAGKCVSGVTLQI